MRILLGIVTVIFICVELTGSIEAKPPSDRFSIDNSDFSPVFIDPSLIKPTKQPPTPPTDIPVSVPIVVTITPVKPASPVKPTVYSDPKAYALTQIGSIQFSCLDKLWIRESNWNPLDVNKSSGAYGIPQALPGTKMAIMGDDWKNNPITQVKWGLYYIKERYGDSCHAWQHSQNYGWY